MKIRWYKELKDPRITKKKSFLKEYLIILSVMMVCCAGAVLMFNEFMNREANPWIMALDISSYVFFMGLLVSLATRYIMYTGFKGPLADLGIAARKVSEGDLSIRVPSRRKDGKKDEIELFIDDFNLMIEELSTIELLKSDFIANISHELKTPLAIIQSYATMLRKEDISKEEKDNYIKAIMEASKRLSELVSNVLRLNKLEHQEIVQHNTFSLAEQIRLCILSLDEKVEEKNIELNIELEEISICSDESLLEIVWNNLLSNAIKFTDQNGKVEIHLKKDKDMAVMTISDSGCGMDEETCRHIFDRFFQGDTSRSAEGNGLGMALVKRVLDLVKGEVTITSEKGKGTSFTVKLKGVTKIC